MAVTGGTGFIGQVLVRRLVEAGENVRVIVRASSQIDELKKLPLEIVRSDLGKESSLTEALSGCQQLYHLAAYARNWSSDPKAFYQVNVQGLKNILEAAKKSGLKRVVYVSSSVVYGPSLTDTVSEASDRKDFPYLTEYEESKALSERIIPEYLKSGLEIVIAKPTRVFGPGKLTEANSVTRMIYWYLRYRICLLLDQGKQIGNYVFVEDVVRGLKLIMEKGRSGENYILGAENISLSGFFNILREVSGRKALRFKISIPLALYLARFESWKARTFGWYPLITEGWVKTFLQNWSFSHRKASLELGYDPRNLREGLRQTCEWLGFRSKETGNNIKAE
ncbi:MAG: NAD-dependent epimerase/dehydratase family protein [Candidatus Saccharicenans sp.]